MATPKYIVLSIIFTHLMFFTAPNVQAGLWYEIPNDSERILEMGTASGKHHLKREFSILVWNIYKGKKATFKQDFKALTSDKDIIVVQESFLTNDLESFFMNDIDFHSWFASSFAYKKSGDKTGVMTSSKVLALDAFYKVSPYREIVGNTPKVALFTSYQVMGSHLPVIVANIHAINSVTASMHQAHIDQVFQVLASHPGPAVLAGDFNTWSRKKLEYLKNKAKKSGLKEVEFPDGSERMHTFGYPLDHVFLRGLCAQNAQIHGDIQGSDHKAMSLKVHPCR
ncbi:MAG: endonuclease/exonuclease/phosphatase family protein [Bdellovibrio sp.]|nr:endonuclease/exonuclease/phosphatase family protein [Bdellovibrio sp.]